MNHIFAVRMTAVIAAVLLSFVSPLCAGDGALSPEFIEQVRTSFAMDAHARAMYNAITNNDIRDLALNRDILHNHSDVFSHKIKARGVTDQKSSGRCWLFAGLNILRPAVIEKYKLGSFEFSQNYLAFWDKMEKANCFLEQVIEFRQRDPLDREMEIILRNPFADGGWWEYVVDLIERYGVIPKEIMPETRSSENTGMMNTLISTKLRTDAVRLRAMHAEGKSVRELRAEKEKMLSSIYGMLVLNLGRPPDQFSWRFEDRDSVVSEPKTYTPRQFYEEFVGVDLKEYVNIFNDPTKEYGKHYRIRLTRNMYDREDISYANVDIEVLRDVAARSVLDDEPVWFACDVGQDQSRKHGVMALGVYDYGSIYNVDLTMTKAERAMYRQSAPNHAMVFVGVDIRDGRPVKWLVENSWGTNDGDRGYWTLYDSWFDSHVYNVIVKRKYVPENVLRIYKQDPITLPPWDPMYSFVR